MVFPMQIEKVYEPQRFEPHWAQWWIDSGIFRASAENPGRVFSLVIPPPNVTGFLHIGHMLEHTEIDVTVRWHRMLGDNTLWLPGTDHAGIATQMVVERQLAEEGINHRDLGREEFEERVWQWKAAIRRHHQAADDPPRRQLRLDPRALHPRPRPLPRRPRSLRPPLRKRPASTAASTWSTGARAARPRSPISKSRTTSRRAPLAHPLPRQRHRTATSSSPPPAPKPCSATPPSPSMPRTPAISTCTARPSSSR